jgi:hypothetical protein
VSGYFLSWQADYVQPTVTVDHGALHFEARYDYEAMRTGSVWAGWNLAWGDSLKFTLTPMVGGVFGDVNGLAAGAEWDLSWGPLELDSQLELVFDLSRWSGSDFYTWTEMSLWALDWARAGIALQRTRAIDTSRVIQWGPLVGLTVWKLSGGVYWFNPGQAGAQYWVASASGAF